MNTQIFVCTHKPFDPPLEEGYVPLHVGRALGQDLGYLGDDTGDSISDLNPYYGELTGLYWIWKNVHDPDIVGLCHYRRYFQNKDKSLLSANAYENILSKYDVIVSSAEHLDCPYADEYAQAHNLQDLLTTGTVIQKLYPSYSASFYDVMNGTMKYYGNLCAMKKPLFDRYCEWLFAIFFELETYVDVSGYDDYHKRLFGFLSENLLLVFIRANHLNAYECPVGITAEKAETTEFKLAMEQLVKIGQFSEARTLFYEYQKIRPDIRLQLSDILNEIPDIEIILYILEQEQKNQLSSFYSYSHSLKDLIHHLRSIRNILSKQKQGLPLTNEEKKLISSPQLSEIAKKIILINM